MNKIEALNAELAKKDAEDAIIASDNFNQESVELTDEEEQCLLEKMKNKKHIVVVEETSNGKVETNIEAYAESLDKSIKILSDKNIKLLKTKEELTNSNHLDMVVNEMMNRVQGLTKTDICSSDDCQAKFLALSDEALESIRKYLKVDMLSSSNATKLFKKPLSELVAILPKEFVNTFVTDDEIVRYQMASREKLVTAISYLTVTGPDLDSLNDYITTQNKLINVMIKLNQCNIGVTEILQNKKSLKELFEEVMRNSNDVDGTYMKYTKTPDVINNLYTQNSIIMKKMAEAYIELRNTLTDQVEIDAVNAEISRNTKLASMYLEVLNLTTFAEVFNNYNDNMYDVSSKHIIADAKNAVDRVKRCKQSVSFPGFKGSEKNINEIYINYTKQFDINVKAYNSVLDKAIKDGVNNLEKIDCNPKAFSDILLIVMGRIVKRLTKNTSTDVDAMELDTMFGVLCRLGTELFMMNKIYLIMKPLLVKIDDLY